MGCLEDLNTSLELIASRLECVCNAVLGGSAARGSGGSGTFAAPEASFVDNGTDFPDGYTDRAEYDTSKCDLSQFVIDRFLGDLAKLRQINVAGQAAQTLSTILVVTLVTPIPFDDILALLSPILALAALGINVFVTALDELTTRMEAMSICELYEAQDVGQAVENVDAWIEGGTYTQQSLTELVGTYLFGTDAANVLFEPKSDAINYDELPEGDCSSCTIPCLVVWDFASDAEGFTFTDESVPPSSAAGAWSSAEDGVLRNTFDIPGDPNQLARATWELDLESIGLIPTAGDVLKMWFGPTSDGTVLSSRVRLYYTDDSFEGAALSVSDAGMVSITLAAVPVGETIKTVQLSQARATTTGTPFNWTCDILSAQLNLQNPTNCP